MGRPVVTVASGGLPVVDATAFGKGTPVTEDVNLRGIAVTKVANLGIPVCYETFGTGGGGTLAAFDPATTTNVTLSNGNLTATHINAVNFSGVRVATRATTGKYYFEMTFATVTAANAMGLITQTGTYNDLMINNNCTIVFQTSWVASNNTGAVINLGGSFINGTVIGVAVDLTARLAWFRAGAALWNNSGTANPATGVAGVVMAPTVAFSPVAAFATGSGDVSTANFGATAYANAAPSGFLKWPGP